MAIHFNYIKGLNGDTRTLTGDQSDSIYTYIKWANRKGFRMASGEVTNAGSVASDAACLPHIIVSKNNSLDSSSTSTNQFDCGHIITSDAQYQSIRQEIGLLVGKYLCFIDKDENEFSYSDNEERAYIGANSTASLQVFGKTITITCGSATSNRILFNGNEATFNSNIIATKGMTLTSGSLTVKTGNVNIGGYCEASFFNATSDQRAKTHIQYWDTSALDIVCSLPIYEFRYKNNNTPSIGVIAQEATQFDNRFENFSLVDNPQATGENGDYMTIKESKLVYILWKAVQEQQEQIERLKAELREIKESL